ncbi:MAG TPA: glycosyltransferase family 9 protein [Candidatus Udaeobacter sp.]|nr:glycosyltransferase family 9 protein [Candidatus Udaeobacter sp.]
MNRILVIRGGAIGDFILTLPALKALRDARPQAHMEILGYKHIAALAEKRFYAQAVRSIEYARLARFFARNSELPAELADYFASFDLIVSYLYDPDQIFETNLRRCGVENLICGPARIVENAGHAARQLARPIEALGISVVDLAERIFPSVEDREFAREFLASKPQPIIATHPGSGSQAKNWPLENWIGLFSPNRRFADFERMVVISGEADKAQTDQLEQEWNNRDVRFARNLPLPHLAAILERAIFIGHDSGISHLAAAAGAKCIFLFGPTDPDVWAPKNDNVQIVRAPNAKLNDLSIEEVETALAATL